MERERVGLGRAKCVVYLGEEGLIGRLTVHHGPSMNRDQKANVW